MRLFKCSHCGQPAYFENNLCIRCGHQLGFCPQKTELLTLIHSGDRTWTDIKSTEEYRYCANSQYQVCNWLLQFNDPHTLCIACQLNHIIPDLKNDENIILWKKLEIAKHRLVYALLRLKLPVDTRSTHPDTGLAFDFPSGENVVMGHDSGLITINLNEADEVKRIAMREKLHEPYRTILGHFRHEIGHYYWDRLIQNSKKNLNEFRAMFGDERVDYNEALQQYYHQGPASNWSESFISGYATAHPWEDWAETWAHYLHVMDALEIAWSLGIEINPVDISKSEKMDAEYKKDPYQVADFSKLIRLWFPLTIALNSMNRSIGQPDFYPFIIPAPVVAKLNFIHTICRSQQQSL